MIFFLAKSAITSRTSVVFLAQQPNLPSSRKTSKCKQTLSKVKYVNSMFFNTITNKKSEFFVKCNVYTFINKYLVDRWR